jgi:hypothetical protein
MRCIGSGVEKTGGYGYQVRSKDFLDCKSSIRSFLQLGFDELDDRTTSAQSKCNLQVGAKVNLKQRHL